MIEIVGMFPGDGRRLRRRTATGGCQRTGTHPAAPDDRCSTSRDDSVISRGDPRGPRSIRTANGLSAARGSVVWDGFPAIPFRGADPTRLRIYFGEQLSGNVLMPATDRSPRCPGCSSGAVPRVFRDQTLSLVTLRLVVNDVGEPYNIARPFGGSPLSVISNAAGSSGPMFGPTLGDLLQPGHRGGGPMQEGPGCSIW